MTIWLLKYPFTAVVALFLCACQPPQNAIETAKQIDGPTFDAQDVWHDIRKDFDLFYSYRDLRGFDADAYLGRVGDIVVNAEDRDAFRAALHRATFAFTDPHLGFGPRTDADFNTIPTAADVQVGYENGRYVILDVRADSAALSAGLRPGWEILAIDGTAMDAHIEAIFDGLIDQPDTAQRAYAATLAANGRRAGERHLDLRLPNGTEQTVTLANPRTLATAVMARPMIETRRINAADSTEIAVLRINNRLGDNGLITAFDEALQAVLDADGIILDLRNTPSGGNSEVGRSIMGHFTDSVRPFQIHEVPSLEREFTVPRRFIEQVFPRAPYFDPAKTVVLGGYWTGSMGEGIVIGMDALGIKTVASDMGDLLGGMSNFSFDQGRITLSIPTETLFHVDGTPREDFTASTALTSADSDADGSDPALAAALALLTAP